MKKRTLKNETEKKERKASTMLYRIYTEEMNEKEIEKIVKKYYPGFTILKAEGFWKVQKEHSLIIEIATGTEDEKISNVAKEIKEVNHQEKVLVQRINNNQWLV